MIHGIFLLPKVPILRGLDIMFVLASSFIIQVTYGLITP